MSSEFVKEIREELALEEEQNPFPVKPVKEIPEIRCYTVPELQIECCIMKMLEVADQKCRKPT